MNFLDKAISYVSPVAGARRLRARDAIRVYEGATVGRRTSSWRAQQGSLNAELMYGLRPLRDRSRDLARNTPHAARMLDIITSHTVGTGIVPVSATGFDKIDRQVGQLWEDWQACADITGRQNYYSMQALSVRSMVESGEVVLRLLDRQLEDKLPVPFQLQLLEADYIDQYRDGIYGIVASKDLRRSRLGVGLGEYDKFVGLWLYREHPGDFSTFQSAPYVSDFCEAEDLLHMFKDLRPGQVRGVPWMAPILTTARDLADFLDAANVKARVEACFVGYITNDDSSGPALMDPTPDGRLMADASNPNATVSSLEPGTMKELRAGQDITFAQPTSTSQVEPILMFDLQAMAAGVGCTYDQITGDLRQANYSSLRAGKLDFWRLIAQLQKHTVIPKLCQPTWDRFISRAILSGRLRPRAGGYPCDWVVPAKEMIDPKKDFDAAKNSVRAGAMTPQQFIASFGGEWRTNLDDFEAFFTDAKDRDVPVVLDIDVSRVDQRGRAPASQDPRKPGFTHPGDSADVQDAQDTADDAADAADESP